MKTQVSILVRNASLYARAKTLFWFVNIFKKLPVNVWIDEDPETAKNPTMVLKASEKPYEIDLAPGHHVLYFSDPKAGEKRFTNAVTGAFLGEALRACGRRHRSGSGQREFRGSGLCFLCAERGGCI